MSNRLTLREAAAEAGYSYGHFRRIVVEEGRIPYSQPGGRKGKIFVSRAAIEKLHAGTSDKPKRTKWRRSW